MPNNSMTFMYFFYDPNIDNSAAQHTLSEAEGKHIVQVLRKKEGDRLYITNGKGYVFEVEILEANPKRCKVKIMDVDKRIPSKHRLHMAVAPTKNNDRFEWFLEKATEIGVHEITPILCTRSERKTIKRERLSKVVQSAMKQSLQAHLPQLNEAIPFSEFVSKANADLTFIAHCAEEEKLDLKRRVAPDKDVLILIGPEGDFTPEEIDLAYENGFLPVSLGKNRLRTETAALVACTTVTIINNG